MKTGLLKCRLVHGEEWVSFCDVLVRDVLYEEVSPLKRKKLHNAVGSALEKAYANKIEEHFGELASHFLESNNKDKALSYYLKAGEKAARVYANKEAAFYYESALKLLEEKENNNRDRIQILETLGSLEELSADYDACLKHRNDALFLLEQLADKKKIAKLCRKISFVLWMRKGDLKGAKEYQDKALRILEAEPESAELAGLQLDIADMLWHCGETRGAYPLVEKALQVSENINDNESKAHAYQFMGKLLSFSGDREKAYEYSKKALKLALDNGYTETALEAYSDLSHEVRSSTEANSTTQHSRRVSSERVRIGKKSRSHLSSILDWQSNGDRVDSREGH